MAYLVSDNSCIEADPLLNASVNHCKLMRDLTAAVSIATGPYSSSRNVPNVANDHERWCMCETMSLRNE
jgi:hypothetical protein